MKRKYILVLIAILVPIVIVATCIRYSITLKKHGYQPESIADFFWQGSHWGDYAYMVTQNVAEYPLTEDLTIRCAIERDSRIAGNYSLDYIRVNSVFGPYYIATRRDASVKYSNGIHNLDNTGERFSLDVIERPDCLILLVKSDYVFVDLYGKPVFTHTYGEDYPDQYGKVVYYQYFIVPELKDLPDNYYLSGGPFTVTMANFKKWQDEGFLK